MTIRHGYQNGLDRNVRFILDVHVDSWKIIFYV